MKNTISTTARYRGALYATAGVAALAFAAPAFAQDAPEDCVDANDNGICDTEEGPTTSSSPVVITGTRISRPTLSSPVPLTSVTASELTDQGDISLGDALNDLPSLRTTFSTGNSTRFIGTAGLNLLDLRGLGTARTLVLVNGKRHITASPGDYLVDVNTIPTDLLERVDVVTGGNSAVYGSDAVAGVVNFILKRDFEGLSLRGQAGISERGDRATQFIAGVWGMNFADGRGNIAVAAEYANAEPLYFRERDDITGAYSGRCQYNAQEPTGGEPFGTDGVPDTAPICGVFNNSVSDGGTIGVFGDRSALRFDNAGNIYRDFPRNPLGSYTGNVIGANGSSLRNTGQLAAGVERHTLNVLARYDVSDAFKPFLEAKYAHVSAIQEGQPSFFVGGPSFAFGAAPASFSCANPFLSNQARSTLAGFGFCGGPGNQTGTFPLSRFNVDFGGRGEFQDRDTYRIVAGVEGTFNDDWNYELSVNYGRFESFLRSINNLVGADVNGNPDGFTLAIDAVRDPVTGLPVCRVNADADPTNDRPDCVALNVFGDGAPSQAALDFVNTTTTRTEEAEQFVVLGSVGGDLSQLFELPGGPIAFAIGGEYRAETASSAFDPLVQSGGTFLNAIQPFNPPKLEVVEGFAEVSIPLLAGLPFAEELTISGAARVSDYNTAVGTVWAYNINGIYAPINDVRFRAAYATSVRAPTQSDLFSPQSQNFAFLGDPCDVATGAINNNPNRAANCAADGVPTTANAALVAACAGTSFPVALGDPYTECRARTSSASFLSGGNPTLIEEKGESLTLGAVFQPRFIPGLVFTIDYYSIEIEDQIATLGAQTILNNCYDSPLGLGNPFCSTVQRDANGLFDTNQVVISGGINFASRKTEGIDFDLQYNYTFENDHRLSVRAIATRLIRLNFFEDPTDPNNPNRIKSELGDPEWAASFTATYDIGDVQFRWSMRFLDEQTKGAYESSFPYIGRCTAQSGGQFVTGFNLTPCTGGAFAVLDPANNDLYSDPYFPVRVYHNVRLDWDVEDALSFYFGVDNLLDTKPPFGQLGTGGGDPYDTFGRYFYAGFTADF